MSEIQIFPSILNADWDHMDKELEKLKEAGADGIHLDIMDGRFVPEKTFDLESIRKFVALSDLFFDAHLMIVEPQKFVDGYIDCGVDSITFHLETCDGNHAINLADYIKSKGLMAGIAINPDGEIQPIIEMIEHFDLILFMSVFPGYGGQKFISEVLGNVRILKKYCDHNKLKRVIQIDGGINDKTAPITIQAGVNNLVAGTYILKDKDYKARIES
ncbi:MAG: ribulose-phosphate 3-epimerase, partial [Elusimicrobiota bacterium]